MNSEELIEASLAGIVCLVYNGNRTSPDRLGFIPGVTPAPGVTPGTEIEITDDMLRAMHRPTGPDGAASFVVEMIRRYNAGLGYDKWSISLRIPEEDDPEHVQFKQPPESVEQGEVDTENTVHTDEGE